MNADGINVLYFASGDRSPTLHIGMPCVC